MWLLIACAPDDDSGGATGPELCDNGIDDDGDGVPDCGDAGCAGDPACDDDPSTTGSETASTGALFPDATLVELEAGTPAAGSGELDEAATTEVFAVDLDEGVDLVFYAESAQVDLAIRVYDPAGTLVASVEDAPYDVHGDAPGGWIRAGAGRWYVEVLDEVDLDGSSTGGEDRGYTLSLLATALSEPDEADNDDLGEAEAALADGESFATPPWSELAGDAGSVGFVAGAVQDGDADWIGLSWEGEDPGLYELSLVESGSGLDARFEIYDADGALLAETEDASLGGALGPGADAGLACLFTGPGQAFLRVADDGDGEGHYGVIARKRAFVAELSTVHDLPAAVEADEQVEAVELLLSPDAGAADAGYGLLFGRMEDDDAWDSFHLSVEPGQRITVDLATMGLGSLLDASLRLVDGDGVSLASSEGRDGATDDPWLQADVDDTELWLVVEAENDARGDGAFYAGAVWVDTP